MQKNADQHFLIRGNPLLVDLLEDVSPSDHLALHAESVLLTILEEFPTSPLEIQVTLASLTSQLLALIFRFEQYLLRLIRMDAFVDVFFSKDNRILCTPFQLLARETIFNHLHHTSKDSFALHHSPTELQHFSLHELESSKQFPEFLERINPKYCFFHYAQDGAWTPLLESLMLTTLGNSRDFAFTNQLEHRNNKIYGYRVRHLAEQHRELPAALASLERLSSSLNPAPQPANRYDTKSPRPDLPSVASSLDACAAALRSLSADDRKRWAFLAQSILVQALFLEAVPLPQRCHAVNLENPAWSTLQVGAFLEKFVPALAHVVQGSTQQLSDPFDSRLWFKVLENYQAPSLGLPAASLERLNALAAELGLPAPGTALPADLAAALKSLERASVPGGPVATQVNASVSKILGVDGYFLATNPLEKVLAPLEWHKDIDLNVDWVLRERQEEAAKEAKRQKKQKDRSRQQLFDHLQKYAESLQNASVQRQTIVVDKEKDKKAKEKKAAKPQHKDKKGPSKREQLQSNIQEDKDAKDGAKFLEEYATLKRLWKGKSDQIKFERVNLFIRSCPHHRMLLLLFLPHPFLSPCL